MQSTLLQQELTQATAHETHRAVAAHRQRVTHPPPPRPARRRAARVLARLAWRLDREAALRAWPQ
jgi:hypothetical protein